MEPVTYAQSPSARYYFLDEAEFPPEPGVNLGNLIEKSTLARILMKEAYKEMCKRRALRTRN